MLKHEIYTNQLKRLEDCAGVLPDSSCKAGVCRVRVPYLLLEWGWAQHKKVLCNYFFLKKEKENLYILFF